MEHDCFFDGKQKVSMGFTLIEVLVAFAFLSAGLIVIVSFSIGVQSGIVEARNLYGAIVVAEQKRSDFEQIADIEDVRLRDGMDSITVNHVTYFRNWIIAVDDWSPLMTVRINVSGFDRSDAARSVILESARVIDDRSIGTSSLLLSISHARQEFSYRPWGI